MSLLLLAAIALAKDPDPSWWVGLPVADVALTAPLGGLPEESLEPLLRVEQGQRLNPTALRLDLATLYRVGEFSSVEADAQPWPWTTPDGDLVPGVLVTYTVLPAPRVAQIHVQTQGEAKPAVLLDALDFHEGSVYYDELDTPRTTSRLHQTLVDQGFPHPEVEVDPMPLDDGSLELWLRVAEGEPQLLSGLNVRGDLPVPESRIQRWARREGLRVGHPLPPPAIPAAQYAIRQHLATGGQNPWSLTRAWFRERELGWLSARVGAAATRAEGGVELNYTVEAGPLLTLHVSGLPWRGPQRVQEALRVDERTRLTRGFLEAAPDRIANDLRRQGFLDAVVTTSLLPADSGQTLQVNIEKGARHTLRDRLFARSTSEKRGLSFRGNSALPDWQLRAVMRQASPEVVRTGRVTPDELAKGLIALREQYAAAGYHEAHLTLAPLETGAKLSLWRLPGLRRLRLAATGSPASRWVQVSVDVEEGPLTTLETVTIAGGASDLPLEDLRETARKLEGGPWAPARLQTLALLVQRRHRDAGYLDATVKTVMTAEADHRVSAQLVVDAGEPVLLRSVVMRGLTHTRSAFARRQVDLTLTEAVSESELQAARSNLYDLGVFRAVQTDLIGDELARDLVITVEERPRKAAELGGGISSDEGLRLFGRYTRRNLLRIAHRLDLDSYVGLPTTDPSTYEFRAAAIYTAPHFPKPSEELELDALLQDRTIERGWELARSGGGLTMGARLGGHTELRLGARAEWRRLLDVDSGMLLPGEVWSSLATDSNPWRPAHEANLLLVHDRRDDPVSPSRGSLLSARATYGPPIGKEGRTTPMLALGASARGVLRLHGGPALHLSADVDHAESLGDSVIALEDRYRLGGTGSLRGFSRNSVGPQLEVPALDIPWPDDLGAPIDAELALSPTRWVSTGGDTRATLSAELVLPLPTLGLASWEGYAVTLFVDAGDAWFLDSSVHITSDEARVRALVDPPVRVGTGLGLRMDTPVGPLRVDIAVNPLLLMASPDAQELLREGWHETLVRPHLSLGTLL